MLQTFKSQLHSIKFVMFVVSVSVIILAAVAKTIFKAFPIVEFYAAIGGVFAGGTWGKAWADRAEFQANGSQPKEG